jgi:signal peptidase I
MTQEANLAGNSALTSIKINGDSMFPLIKDGEAVIAKAIDYHQAKIGDILAYHNVQDNVTIVHRLIKKSIIGNKIIFITQGDANASYYCDDAFDPRQAQLKKVVAIIKNNGILNLENTADKFAGQIKARLLWYVPFLISPQRRFKKIISSPGQIPQRLIKNVEQLIRRLNAKLIISGICRRKYLSNGRR